LVLTCKLVKILWLQYKFVKAVKYYKKAIELSKDKGDNLALNRSVNNLGNLYRILGKYDEALILFKSILLSTPDDKDFNGTIVLLLNISRTYTSLKKYKYAEEYADKAFYLANCLEDFHQYILSLISKININIEILNIKKIISLHLLLIKIKEKVKQSPKDFDIKIITYKVNFLELLFESKKIHREKPMIDIFKEISLEIEDCKDNKTPKMELSFLYCKLYKYLYDHSKKQKINIAEIEDIIKDNYILNKKESIEFLISQSSLSPNVAYKNRLKELEKFPDIR